MLHQKRRKMRMNRIKADAGASLIVVVCVSAFLVAFALAMVYTGSLLMARANRQLEQERCYQLARSFAGVLDEELNRYSNETDLKVLETDSAYADSFYKFACKFIESAEYMEYNPEYPDISKFYYRMDAGAAGAVGDNYGKITIILYKESDQGGSVLTGSLPTGWESDAGSGGTAANPINYVMADISRYTFHVEVVAEYKGMTYNYATSYDPRVKYQDEAVQFSVGEEKIIWKNDEGKWYKALGGEYTPDGATINYEITPSLSKLKSCSYKKTIAEEIAAGTEEGEGGG